MDVKELIIPAATLVAYLVGLGVLWGRQDANATHLKAENDKRVAEIKLLEESIADGYAEIKHLFLTVDNEPKYISYTAYDKIQVNCHGMILLKMDHIRENQLALKAEQQDFKNGLARIEKLLIDRSIGGPFEKNGSGS